jgi:hypothetical protein
MDPAHCMSSWCQQLTKFYDKLGQLPFLPPGISPTISAFLPNSKRLSNPVYPKGHLDWNVPFVDQQEPHHFERVCVCAYGPGLLHWDCPPQASPTSCRTMQGVA